MGKHTNVDKKKKEVKQIYGSFWLKNSKTHWLFGAAICRNSWRGCKKIMVFIIRNHQCWRFACQTNLHWCLCVCVFLLHERDFFHSLGVITKPFDVRSSEVVWKSSPEWSLKIHDHDSRFFASTLQSPPSLLLGHNCSFSHRTASPGHLWRGWVFLRDLGGLWFELPDLKSRSHMCDVQNPFDKTCMIPVGY